MVPVLPFAVRRFTAPIQARINHTLPFALLLAIAMPAIGQQPYPVKPVRIVSLFPPGGGNDTICRIVAPALAANLKQQVIVENRAGANGIVGTEVVARSAPDGYTVTLIPSGHAVDATPYQER